MEMAFATGGTVMKTVEDLVKSLFTWLGQNWALKPKDGELVPIETVIYPHYLIVHY